MRRGISETPHGVNGASSSSTAAAAAASRHHPAAVSRRHTKVSGKVSSPTSTSATTAKKRRMFYMLLAAVLLFQGVIFPWFLAQPAVSNYGQDMNNLHTLRGANTQPQQPQRSAAAAAADGTFNGHPIYLQERNVPFYSSVHCVGETHNPDTAWMYRSCEFTNVCLDTATKEFFVVESSLEHELQEHRVPQSYVSTELSSSSNSSSVTNLTVALGGINPRWVGKDFNQGIDKVRWFPQRVPQSQVPSHYYVLDSQVVLVPFHSFAAHNVGHMLWDDFLPIYTLLQLFGWNDDLIGGGGRNQQQQQKQQLLLLRVDTLPLLYGTCEMRKKKGKKCAENFEKFLPLLGVDPKTFSTVQHLQFQPKNNHTSASWICAKHAMAGLGMLTDHGLKDHGWLMPKETHSVQNTAKGALLYQFRNALLHNLGLPVTPNNDIPLQIVLSAHSSGDPPRDNHFINQQNVLTRAFPDIPVQTVELSKLGLYEQVELISQKTRIFVSTCGGGAMTATFLPKGATLILYYDDDGGYDFAHDFNLTGDPAFLDWDLFNNMAYLRVHWLPIGSMNTQEGWKTLAYLIRHELQVMESGV
jgi:hypothetical protein